MSIHVQEIQLNTAKSTIMLSIPIIILLFLNSLYALIDLFWIGGLGTTAVICMGYIANVIYTINKVGDGIGRAANVLISNAFGAKEIEMTEKYAEHGLFLILVCSIIFPIITIPLIKPICAMAGITEYSNMIYVYIAPCLGFIIMIMLNNYFSAILGSEGDTKRATIIITVGNILNIVLDPILIFNLKMGMIGAAISTIMGGLFSAILFIHLYSIKKDTLVEIHPKKFKLEWKIIKEIIVLAIPIILDGIILSLLGMIITISIHIYATPVVVFSYIILLNIQTTIFTPILGIAKGLSIVIGHLAGAKRFIEIRKTIIKIFAFGLGIALFIALGLTIFHNPIISIFSTEYVVINEVKNLLIFSIIYIITAPLITGCSYVFLGLEKSIYTLIFIIFNLITVVIFILIFSHLLGLSSFGVLLSVALSNIIETVLMLLVLRRMLNSRIERYEPEKLIP